MMNITPQELNSYIVQNHGSPHSADYLYTCHPAPLIQYIHHHPLSVGSVGCASSQQTSSDDDLTFYTSNVVTPSLSHSSIPQQPFVGSENGNITTSLYGLVTGNPSCFSAAPITSSQQQQQQQQQSLYSSHHLHPHSASSGGVPHPHPHHHQQQQQQQQEQHHHHHQHNRSSRSSHHPSSSASSNLSQQSYKALSGTGAGVVGNERNMTDVSSSVSPFQQQNHPSKHYQNHQNGGHHRKRKSHVPRVVETEPPDDDSETCSSRRTTTPTDESSKKQNHSEIEKRRRDKMNTYITELSGMVPMCSAMSRKLDKLTVLRMAVQHMKTLRGSRIHSYTEGHYKPSFLTDEELKHLILQSAEGFLFVVGCDRGRLLYVSESVSQVLNYTQSDLLGQSWFDILHPKDVAKVKEQLSSSDLSPRERLIDAKTMLPVKGNVPQKANRLCPGARRSFFCRMKCKSSPLIKEEADSSSSGGCQRRKKSSSCERKYCVIHCTGYLKSWAKVGMEDCEGETDDPCNLSCLVAVGRILNPISTPSSNPLHRPVTFISRHAIDGKFVFVDQRTTLVVGFLPQELLGTSMYEYFHHKDITSLADIHKAVLQVDEAMTTQLYKFRTRNGNYIKLQSSWKAFRNPWTKDIECIIAKNTLALEHNKSWSFRLSEEFLDMDVDDCTDGSLNRDDNVGENTDVRSADPSLKGNEFDFFSGNGNGGSGMGAREIQRLINSEVPFRKIGEQIADEMGHNQRRSDSSLSNSLVSIHDPVALGIVNTTISSASEAQNSGLSTMLSPSGIMPTILLTNSSNPQQEQNTQLQGSTQSNQAAVPQRQINSCSSPNGGNEGNLTIGQSGSNQSEGAAEGLTISSRMNDPIIGAAAPGTNVPTDEEMLYMIRDSVLPESPQQTTNGDGNDEAAMAVIMSLLEADAGLGGPVDFSGLPWPLP